MKYEFVEIFICLKIYRSTFFEERERNFRQIRKKNAGKLEIWGEIAEKTSAA